MNKPYNTIKSLIQFYGWKELALSALTGFLFFIFPTVLLLTVSINIMFIYSRIYVSIYGITLLLNVAITIYATARVIETIKHYQIVEQIDYKAIQVQLSVITSILVVAVYYVVFYFL